MFDVPTVRVEAITDACRTLKHFPSGAALDADGKGEWPADAFTFALIRDGDMRRAPEVEPAPAPEPAAARKPTPATPASAKKKA
jgi:hypothetical protein